MFVLQTIRNKVRFIGHKLNYTKTVACCSSMRRIQIKSCKYFCYHNRRYRIYVQNAPDSMKIDYNKLSEAIVQACEKIKDNNEKQKEIEIDKWKKCCGVTAEKGVKRIFQIVLFFIKMPFISKSNMSKDSATIAIAKTVMVNILGIFKIILLIGILFSVCLMFNMLNFAGWTFYNLRGIFLLLSFYILYAVIRMSAIEINQMYDRQYLSAIFSSLISFIAMALTVAALYMRKI